MSKSQDHSINDVETGNPEIITTTKTNFAITLQIRAYGRKTQPPGTAPTVLLEIRNGTPHLLVWADINEEDPTHEISLENAHEKHRENENDDPPYTDASDLEDGTLLGHGQPE